MSIMHTEKAAALQADKVRVIPSMSLTKTSICQNFRDMKTKHQVKIMNGEAVALMKIKVVGIILKPRKHCIGI